MGRTIAIPNPNSNSNSNFLFPPLLLSISNSNSYTSCCYCCCHFICRSGYVCVYAPARSLRATSLRATYFPFPFHLNTYCFYCCCHRSCGSGHVCMRVSSIAARYLLPISNLNSYTYCCYCCCHRSCSSSCVCMRVSSAAARYCQLVSCITLLVSWFSGLRPTIVMIVVCHTTNLHLHFPYS